MPGQGGAGGPQAILTEGILLVEHGDPVAAGTQQIIHHPVDLRLIASPQVEHHGPEGLTQQPCAGEGGHQRDRCLLHQRQNRLHRWGAHEAEQHEGTIVIDQPARVAQGEGGFVAIVETHKPKLASMDAAAAVDLVEPGQRSLPVVAAQPGGGPAQRGRLAEHEVGPAIPGRRRLGRGIRA